MRYFENLRNFFNSPEAQYLSYLFALFTTIVGLFHIIQHLRNFSMPQIQTYIVRILMICPIFSVSSSLALAIGEKGQYILITRDMYEAVVVYSFLNLILEFCGGETDCVYKIENDPPLNMPFPLCFLSPKPRNARFMRFCCRGVLQFVLVKPIVSVIDLIFLICDQESNYIWQIFRIGIYNISYTFALYCLFIFYVATSRLIKPFRPIYKFASVKAIIFATYYQSLIILIAAKFVNGGISQQDQQNMNNILVCAEMVFFSLFLLLAFPIKEFVGGIPDRSILRGIQHVFTLKDVFQNFKHNFDPIYHDYCLQPAQSEAPDTERLKAYFSGNLNSTALKMTEVYRGHSRRIAFNSLLRGDKPLRARLRSDSKLDLAYEAPFDEETAMPLTASNKSMISEATDYRYSNDTLPNDQNRNVDEGFLDNSQTLQSNEYDNSNNNNNNSNENNTISSINTSKPPENTNKFMLNMKGVRWANNKSLLRLTSRTRKNSNASEGDVTELSI